MQQQIKETTWDEKTGRPQSKLDLELDDILASGETMDYVDMTLLEETITRPVAAKTTFIPQLDDDSVSKFGTVKDKKTRSIGLTRSTIPDDDSNTLASSVTMDSRMSVIEHDFSGMKNMLSKIFDKVNTGSTVTQPSTIQEAGSTSVPSATGV